jgi:hypothetical protein
MFCIIDKNTNKVIKIGYTCSAFPNSEQINENDEIPQGYTKDNILLFKWNDDDPKTQQLFQLYKEFTAIIDTNGNRTGFTETDLPVPPPQPTPDEITAQTIAQLTFDNADLKAQLQTLAQTIATMQLGGV